MDDDLVDYHVWDAPAPPPGIADGVLARMARASGVPALEPERAPRRPWVVPAALGLGIGAIAATTLMLIDRPATPAPTTSASGDVTATGARHLVLPGGTADVDPGGEVTWHDDAAELRAGAATWQVHGHMTITAGTAKIDAREASLRVTTGATVGVVVYTGLVSVAQGNDSTPVLPGATFTAGTDQDRVAQHADDVKRLEAELADLQRQRAELEDKIHRLETPGALGADSFEHVIDGQRPRLTSCAHRATTSATVTPIVDVGADGAVTHVEVPSTAGDDYQACVSETLLGTVFPHSSHGGTFKFALYVALDHDLLAAPGGASVPCDADALESEGDHLLSIGQYAAASDKLEAAIACRPSDVRARQRAVLAACEGHDAKRANRQWVLLPVGSRIDDLVQGCAANNVLLLK